MKNLALLFLAFLASVRAADVVPADANFGIYGLNTYTGVVGGIPNRTNIIDATSYGVSEANSAAANQAAFAAALAASAEGDVIYIPAGDYPWLNISLSKNTGYVNRTIRGAGSKGGSITRLVVTTNTAAFTIGSGTNFSGAPTSEVVSMTRGSNTITLASSSTLYSGYRQMFRVSLKAESVTPMFLSNYENPDGIAQFNVIATGQSGTTLTLSQPMWHDYAASLARGNATITACFASNQTTTGIGLEDLLIDASSSSATVSLAFNYVENCWAKNVRIFTDGNYAMMMTDAVNCEVRDSYLKGGGNSPSHSGIIPELTTNCLWENNYIEGSPSILFWGGNVNNVFAHSYFNGYVNINHRPWNSHNLFESNAFNYAGSDGYYGGSARDTFHRNWIQSNNLAALKRGSRYYSFIGNIVGSAGMTGTDGTEHFGKPNIGNLAYAGTSVRPSIGTWWPDYDPTNARPLQVQFELTTKSGDKEGIVTILDPSKADDFEARVEKTATSYYRYFFGFNNQFLWFGTRSGNTWPVSSDSALHTSAAGSNLPAQGTIGPVFAGPSGFQELDEDVLLTTFRKSNWYAVHGNAIRSGEELGVGETLATSFYRSTTPSFYSGFTYPPYDPLNVVVPAIGDVPAGYDYLTTQSPEVVSVNVTSVTGGTRLDMVVNKPLTPGTDGTVGATVSITGLGAATLAYLETVSTRISWMFSREILDEEIVSFTYTQPGDGFKDSSGNVLFSLTRAAQNNSQSTSGAEYQYTIAPELATTAIPYDVSNDVDSFFPMVYTKSGTVVALAVKVGTISLANIGFKVAIVDKVGSGGTVLGYSSGINITPAQSNTLVSTNLVAGVHVTAGVTYYLTYKFNNDEDPQVMQQTGLASGASFYWLGPSYPSWPPSTVTYQFQGDTMASIRSRLIPDVIPTALNAGTLNVGSIIRAP